MEGLNNEWRGLGTEVLRSPGGLAASLDEEGTAMSLFCHNPYARLSHKHSVAPQSLAVGHDNSCLGAGSPLAMRCFCRRWKAGSLGEGRSEDWTDHRRGSSIDLSDPGSCIQQYMPTVLEKRQMISRLVSMGVQ